MRRAAGENSWALRGYRRKKEENRQRCDQGR